MTKSILRRRDESSEPEFKMGELVELKSQDNEVLVIMVSDLVRVDTTTFGGIVVYSEHSTDTVGTFKNAWLRFRFTPFSGSILLSS